MLTSPFCYNSLPNELLTHIIIVAVQEKPIKTLCQISLICQKFQDIAFSEYVIKHLFSCKLPKTTENYLSGKISKDNFIKKAASDYRLCFGFDKTVVLESTLPRYSTELKCNFTWCVKNDLIIGKSYRGNICVVNSDFKVIHLYEVQSGDIHVRSQNNKIITSTYNGYGLEILDLKKREHRKLSKLNACSGVICLSDGRTILAGKANAFGRTIRILSQSGQKIKTFHSNHLMKRIKAEDDWLVAELELSFETIALYNLKSYLPENTFRLHNCRLTALIISQNMIITGSATGLLCVIDLSQKVFTYLSRKGKEKQECSYNSSNSQDAIDLPERYEQRFKNNLPRAHRSVIIKLHLTDDKKLISMSKKSIRIWDLNRGRVIKKLKKNYKNKFIPLDGKFLAHTQKGLDIYDYEGNLIQKLRFEENIEKINFHAGKLIARYSSAATHVIMKSWDFTKNSQFNVKLKV